MTAWEPEPDSPLGWAACTRCPSGRALVVQEWAGRAVCGPCLADLHLIARGSMPPPGPVVGARVGGRSPEVRRGVGAPFPAPEWTSRDGLLDGWEPPSSVRLLDGFARTYGWDTLVQYSRGNAMHARTAAPLGMVHVVAIRFGNHPMTDRSAYSLCIAPVREPTVKPKYAWKSHWVWGPDTLPSQLSTLGDMKRWLYEAGHSGV